MNGSLRWSGGMGGEALDSAPILGYVACETYGGFSSTFPFRMRLPVLTYAVILAAVLIWCGGIFLAPVCTAGGGDAARFGQALYQFYHPVCHQIPERSLFLSGHPLGVCTRCASIYLAFLAGTLLFPVLRPLLRRPHSPRAVLLLALAPMLIDATWVGSWIYQVTSLTRVATGAVFGFVLPFVLLPAAMQAARDLFSNDHKQEGFSDA